MIGRIHCWIVRLFGGNHKWSRASKYSAADTKRCSRCGLIAAIKRREKA